MNISLESPSDINQIISYDDDNIVIRTFENQELSLSTDLILSQTSLVTDRTFSIENSQDLDYLISLKPEVVILSTTVANSTLLKLKSRFEENRIGLEYMGLGPACRTYNLLALEGREVVLIINFKS
jgi:uncharacterized protein